MAAVARLIQGCTPEVTLQGDKGGELLVVRVDPWAENPPLSSPENGRGEVVGFRPCHTGISPIVGA